MLCNTILVLQNFCFKKFARKWESFIFATDFALPRWFYGAGCQFWWKVPKRFFYLSNFLFNNTFYYTSSSFTCSNNTFSWVQFQILFTPLPITDVRLLLFACCLGILVGTSSLPSRFPRNVTISITINILFRGCFIQSWSSLLVIEYHFLNTRTQNLRYSENTHTRKVVCSVLVRLKKQSSIRVLCLLAK